MLPKYGSFFRGVVLFHDLEQTSQSLGSRQTPGTRLVNHTFGPLSFLYYTFKSSSVSVAPTVPTMFGRRIAMEATAWDDVRAAVVLVEEFVHGRVYFSCS